MAAAPTRYVIMMDDDVAAYPQDWPVVFVRDSVAELELLEEYSRIWRYLPRSEFATRSTGRRKSLRYVADARSYAGRIYSLRFTGDA